jgi:L-threonylcarbamoyladenylate synthase
MKIEYLTERTASGLLCMADVERVADGLRDGGLAVLPTETGYMLAALATDEPAIERAFAVKGRDLAHTVHVACSSLTMARQFAVLTPEAERLLGRFTPGPLTVVADQTGLLPDRLVTVDGTVGIRVPDQAITQQVISAVGVPLTATSLNKAGQSAVGIAEHELETLAWPSHGVVYVVAEDNSILYAKPSTLVRLNGRDPEILRVGAISENYIRKAL